MKRLKSDKMKMIVVGFVAAVMLGGGSAKADFVIGTATNLGPTVNGSGSEGFPCISVDGLTLYFQDGGGYGADDIWMTTRETTDAPWTPRVNLGPPVNDEQHSGGPSISADGLSLYFHTMDKSYVINLWITTRATTSDNWLEPVKLGPTVNSSSHELCPRISRDGLSLFFTSTRSGGYGRNDLWVATRKTPADDWEPAVNLGPNVNTSADEMGADISGDGLTLFFSSKRLGGSGDYDLWMTVRPTVSDPWGPAKNLGPMFNTAYAECGPSISADGQTVYFCDYVRYRPETLGTLDLYQAPITPICDFNGDGSIDTDDLVIMVDHWGTNETLCDIGPMPWGNGVVDIEDLKVFMKYWEQENIPQNQ